MEKKADIIPFLESVVEKNTRSYQSDFAYDEKRLQAAMLEMYQEDRTFLWMSRPCGTHCVLEREIFLRETGAHSIWTHYDYDIEHIKAFRVIVAPGRPGAFVLGKLQPLNYGEQVRRVKRDALHVETVEMTFEDGEACTMTFEEYRRQVHALTQYHGKIQQICYKPENENELTCVLQAERALSAARKRTRRPRKPQTR